MKITIKGKEYEAEHIPASLSRRAMELNIQALDAAAKAEAVKREKDASGMSALLALLMTNLDAKAQLISEAFGGAVSPEAVLDDLSTAQINAILNEIVK